MSEAPFPARSDPRLGVVIFGALTFLGLVSASRMIVGTRIGAWDALGSGLMDWYLWAPLIPAILALARRHRFGRGSVLRALRVHVPAAMVASLVQIVAFAAASTLVRQFRFDTGTLPEALRTGFSFKFHTGVVVYAALVLGVHVLLDVERSRKDEIRRAELDRQLSETRLRILQSHLHPHFLFNTLNAISATVRTDPDGAERMIVLLGDLLRSALRHREDNELSMREELEFLDIYIEIQKRRFGSRLEVETAVAPEVMDARLPSFVLQPLVENAIHHGIASRQGKGHIRILGLLSDGRLEIAVTDDGPGPGDPGAGDGEREGLGLANTRERLGLLYGDDYVCQLGPGPGSGARVRLSIPFHVNEA